MSDPIYFTRYTFEHPKPPCVEIEMSAEQFTVLQKDSETYDRLTLTQLAEINPHAAYDRLHRIMGAIILSSSAVGTFNMESSIQQRYDGRLEPITPTEYMQLTDDQSTQDAVDEACEKMMRMMPDSPDQDFDLTVNVRLQPDQIEMFCMQSLTILNFSFRKSTTGDHAY